jgi:hypothetical protein
MLLINSEGVDLGYFYWALKDVLAYSTIIYSQYKKKAF